MNPTLDARAKDGPIRNQLAGAVMQPYPIANTLTARMHKGVNSTLDEGQTPVVTHSLRGEGFDASEDGTGRGTPLVPVAIGCDNYNGRLTGDVATTLATQSGDGVSAGPSVMVPVAVDTYNGTITGDLAATLSTRSGVPDATGPSVMTPVAFHPTQDPISSTEVCHRIGANENATAAVAHAIAWDEELNASVEQAGTLLRGGQGGRHDGVAVATVAAFKGGQGSAAGGIGYDEHIAPTLSAADSGSNRTPALLHAMQVRRLTPVECERLQGFPDNYTAIPWRKKTASECPDGPRYKALGNSMAVPVMAWIGKRIQQQEA